MEAISEQGFASDLAACPLTFAPGMIKIFTPSFADEADTNAQNLSAKEIVARLDPRRAAVTMLHEGTIDPRIASRPNTCLLQCRKHGNSARSLLQILRDVPDVYFFPREGPLDAVFLAIRRGLRLKTALVTYVVSGGLYSASYTAARERNIREADAVFANSNYLRLLVKEKLGGDAATLHSGIDRRYFFPSNSRDVPGDSLIVLYAGSFRPYKRVSLVIQHAARWPQVRFRIAGTGEEEQACKALAVQAGCSNVEFLGHLSLAQLGEEMRRADIFFFPSVVEGHPQVLGQAAASGLPAIAMKIYRPDYVIDGLSGFLADTDEELGEKLDLLIRQPERRLAMAQAAIAHAQKFDWDVIAGKWQEAFEQAAALRRKH
jgi:glycosyltransferase involved in cell wall biosynthesis